MLWSDASGGALGKHRATAGFGDLDYEDEWPVHSEMIRESAFLMEMSNPLPLTVLPLTK